MIRIHIQKTVSKYVSFPNRNCGTILLPFTLVKSYLTIINFTFFIPSLMSLSFSGMSHSVTLEESNALNQVK